MRPIPIVACLLLHIAQVRPGVQRSLHVVTVASHETDGLRRLRESAAHFGYSQFSVFGLGEPWRGGDTRTDPGGGQKIRILRRELERYKDDRESVLLFVDAFDVIFTEPAAVLLDRFEEHFLDGVSGKKRVVFSAEPLCWPDPELAADFPVVPFGYRYLNSGMYIGIAADIYGLLTVEEIEDAGDDQLYFQKIYLDDSLRDKFAIDLDSMARLFQNLNGIGDHPALDWQPYSKALTDAPRFFNKVFNTHAAVLHGNGPSKLALNYFSNYISDAWSPTTGCRRCKEADLHDLDDETDLPSVAISLIFNSPTPFVEEMLNAISALVYPKDRLHLFVYNNQPWHKSTVEKWLTDVQDGFASTHWYNGVVDMSAREAADAALDFARSSDANWFLSLNGESHLEPTALLHLVRRAQAYNLEILAPMLLQPGKMFSNFWGALSSDGWYARSDDYMQIANRERVGVWNVPFINSAVLISAKKLQQLQKPYRYNLKVDSDMSLAQYLRHKGHFMYVSNEESYGFLVNSEEFAERIRSSSPPLKPEMYEIFANRKLWERRYVHPDYWPLLAENATIEQACVDVYDYPLMSPQFCRELIAEMEHYGRWSSGTNNDERLTGGYENVPTRDIHMNQIGFERHWLYFLDEFVRPIQEKTFIGYFHRPVEANMMFVVRYKPEEQASLRPHHDASTYSIDVALNEQGKDYEGGGVRYVRQNCTVTADRVGWTMMFPGRLSHLHEGLPTTKGTRYILVSFLNP